MRLKKGYALREVADTWVILPLYGVDLNGMIKVNESGAMLWHGLEEGADLTALVNSLTDKYEVSEEQAKEDVQSFMQQLRQLGCLEE